MDLTPLLPLLFPLISSIGTVAVGIIGSWISYRRGRSRATAEVENLRTEKRSIEAAAGLSTAEAASIISEAAASMIQPLLARQKELQEQLAALTRENTSLRNKVIMLEAQVAMIEKHSELSGEPYPHLY